MTIICYRDGIMAADTAAWEGDLIAYHTKKIAKGPGGALIGSAGESGDCAALTQWFEACAEACARPRKLRCR